MPSRSSPQLTPVPPSLTRRAARGHTSPLPRGGNAGEARLGASIFQGLISEPGGGAPHKRIPTFYTAADQGAAPVSKKYFTDTCEICPV